MFRQVGLAIPLLWLFCLPSYIFPIKEEPITEPVTHGITSNFPHIFCANTVLRMPLYPNDALKPY